MTRTYVDAQSMSRSSRRRAGLRMLLILPVALLLLAAPVTQALAAGSTNTEGLSGYKHTETGKKETPPSKEPQPSKSKEGAKEAAHEEPASTSAPATTAKKASTLPFTGLDLRWTVGFGLLLMGAGAWIIIVQRRQRRGGDR